MAQDTILFVDDEQFTRNLLRRQVSEEPYRAIFATGGSEALALLESEPVAVVVTDLMMSGMDGLTLLSRIQASHPEIIRVVLSARTDNDAILDALNRGCVYRYVVKPWNASEFLITIRQALEFYSIQQERNHLLTELERTNRNLEFRIADRTRQLMDMYSQAEIGKLASQIVHNLNTPLQAIFSAVDLAVDISADSQPDLTRLRHLLEKIRESGGHLDQTIRTVLNQARDRRPYEPGRVDLNAVVKSQVDFFAFNPVFKRQVSRTLELADDLPRIHGHIAQVKQIVDNLIQNAIDAMEFSEEKELILRTRRWAEGVELVVSDSGHGIDPKDRDRIYSPDFTTKPPGKGTGLGLASVKAMVDAYGGKIDVVSEKGRGTTFTVRFPATDA